MFLAEELYCDNYPCWNPALKCFHFSKFLLEMVFVVEFCRNSYVDQGAEDNHCGKNFLLCNEKWWQFNTINTTKTLQRNWFICGITLTTLNPFSIWNCCCCCLLKELTDCFEDINWSPSWRVLSEIFEKFLLTIFDGNET